jgi:POT family proton-dependent oligopeptide transporter
MPIQGNSLPQAGRVIVCSAQNRFRLDAAKPAFQKEKYGKEVPWDNQFVSDIRRGFKAFKVMYVPCHTD